jgi:ABC-type sugar transport system substrate-binding protein
MQKFAFALTQELDAMPGSDCFGHPLILICSPTAVPSVVIPGDHQPPVVHALAHAMNARLGNVGKTVFYTDPVDANPVNQSESIKELVADMNGGKVDLLIILGGNPATMRPPI